MGEPARWGTHSQTSLATAVVCCSIAVSGANSGDFDANQFEVSQSRMHHASTVAPKALMTANQPQATYLRVDDTIGGMLRHPAFGGFARLLLPSDNRTYDPTLSIRSIGTHGGPR